MSNPIISLLNRYRQGEEKMAYEMERGGSTARPGVSAIKQRSFRETIQDQIAYHKSKIADLEAVLESMSPEVEKFVEACQRLN